MSIMNSLKKFVGAWSATNKTSYFLGNIRMENKRLRDRVKNLEALLEEKSNSVEKAKSIFLRNIYHEIRTPLNAIVGFSDLIHLNNINEDEKENYISYIKESSKDFLRKMENIIEASVLEAGMLKLANTDCCLDDIIGEIYTYFSIQKHINNKRIAFLVSIPHEYKDVVIKCDAFRLSQIFLNLLSNAFKYTKQGVIEIGYKLKNNEVEFFVQDTGIGGLKGKEDVIFSSFSKLDSSDTAYEGLGLGLSLSKKLVELMGGKMWYESEKFKGSTFYFTVPYVPVLENKEVLKSQRKRFAQQSFANY